MTSDDRPDPDEIIDRLQKDRAKNARGKLRIFGMCPGVGKTYAMLKAAQEKHAAGHNVVVGLVETHQRQDTEKQIAGLNLLPRKEIEYKGTVVKEFDLDSALALKPEILLVDELPHSNPPGSKHPKRYQDIEDLLRSGIHVYTTLNVQHVESRADLVYQITGVPVRETIPDAFLELADQIEIIDISPQELLKRLNEGKVYLGDRAVVAADNFFKLEKITALRELALRFTAELVDDQLQDEMQSRSIQGPWNTNERLMVAVSFSPFSAKLIRNTRRIAFNLEAPWIALYVDNGKVLTPEQNEDLIKNLNLARELGAEVITTRDNSISDALNRIAKKKNVTQIVMGRPDKRFFQDAFQGGNVLEQLIQQSSDIDIHLLRQERKPVYRGFHLPIPKFHSSKSAYLKTVAYIVSFSALGYLLRPVIGYRAIGFGFLLAVLPIATLASFGPVLLSAALSALIWDFLFIPPQFTFAVGETEDVMMIFAYFAVAIVAGLLSSRVKRQERDLIQREHRANTLYEFGKKLSESENEDQLSKITVRIVEDILPCSANILLSDSGQKLLRGSIVEKDWAVASWSYDNQKIAGWKTETLSSSPCLCIPLVTRKNSLGVLVLYPKDSTPLAPEQMNLLNSIAGHLALALERHKFESDSRKAELFEASEKLHQALLNSISHEFKTPLTAITGASSALSDAKTIENPKNRELMVREIVKSTDRLNRTVENLLDMSRISSGVLKLNQDIFELNDFVRSALSRIGTISENHKLNLKLNAEDLFVSGDEKFLEHVLLNVVGNAFQYSPQNSTVTVLTVKNGTNAEIHILDEGHGIPRADHEKVFERFYRIPGSPPGGVGLGLSLSKAILEAHGGTITVKNRTDSSGAAFICVLPIKEIPKNLMQELS